ncbi:MAG: D-alanyl-D-alanine carboxypeptidase/D-alanyl-D-alanine-endopeptidase [SAR324 cluster bacterium]|uniref:D-alanyl-D-alanine carboxypeptidase/D-alanyl-D-alanine-endopeptidase n=1 Tax=SAR324 cluster bacterium TaxID=2024889 RepID=A0A7X9IIK2_9DELT|nr:D-alanyl-D-alanine carboxypeptidase/D-alanyl-D-alanine-endopeptidase [SAR324 cluster bacterium]
MDPERFRPIIRILFLLAIFLSNANSEALERKDAEQKTKYEMAFALFDLEGKRFVETHNEESPLMPASTQKLILSAAALKSLGPEYRFRTEFFGHLSDNGTIPLLHVRGGHAPDLTIEEIWKITRRLKEQGVRKISSIYLDASRAPDPKPRSGMHAYEGPSGALSVNFNAVAFEICPANAGERARISLNPPEADLEYVSSVKSIDTGELASFQVKDMPCKRKTALQCVSLSGQIAVGTGCQIDYVSVSSPTRYFEKLFTHLLRSNGIGVPSEAIEAVPDQKLPLLYSHVSKPLRQILDDLNHFSTNFIAEQILAALGEDVDGSMKRSRGLERLLQYLESLGGSIQKVKLVDASGLSKDNRLTAGILVRILSDMYHDSKIKPEFLNSLSINGLSGTLKERNFGLSPGAFRGKTGTLDGVMALAGYLEGKGGKIYALALIQNGFDNRERALALELEKVQEAVQKE